MEESDWQEQKMIMAKSTPVFNSRIRISSKGSVEIGALPKPFPSGSEELQGLVALK